MAYETAWDRLVLPHFDLIVARMTPKCFLDKLVAKGLINRREYVELKGQTAADQVRTLLIEWMPTRAPTAYEEFRQVLKDTPEQSYLVDQYFPADENPNDQRDLQHIQNAQSHMVCDGQSQERHNGINRQGTSITTRSDASTNAQHLHLSKDVTTDALGTTLTDASGMLTETFARTCTVK
ncbi:uncharacterized protein LOC134189772 isoform X3 [Corticium candelabrum]|uniref:uncharacterized protein LOC134189772 isoform X3 n=1 Tax=Corticium candelabrum TaxID=121492 RepID=UPI002E276A66|nr:uncharacterized protein LOC134189772 isoform X3 [Corticium candelabrum]